MTPADELRAAAQKLRETAAAASPGPWTVNGWGSVQTARHEEVAEVWPLQSKPDANAACIALMDPCVGLALADLLDGLARFASIHQQLTEAEGRTLDEGDYDRSVRHALAVARALNGDR